MTDPLYLAVPPNISPLRVGSQFSERTEVIDYVDKPLFGAHERVAKYEIRYQVWEIHSQKPFIATLKVISVQRWSGYHEFDKQKTFYTQRGHGFYPNGILNINLPKEGDLFKVQDVDTVWDLCQGYIYSLHRI